MRCNNDRNFSTVTAFLIAWTIRSDMNASKYASTLNYPDLLNSGSHHAHFGTFHSSPVEHSFLTCSGLRLVLTTIGTMVYIDGNNLIKKSGKKTICCQTLALKFVNKNA